MAGRYAYDEEACRAVVVERMQAMGAVLRDGAWTYGGKAVSLTFLSAPDTAARGIGDYLSDRLEALGFKVDRKYVTAGMPPAVAGYRSGRREVEPGDRRLRVDAAAGIGRQPGWRRGF